jgi:hypothetical protein
MKLLAKDPTARYQTAREMIRDLDRIKQAIKATSSSALPVAPPERPPSGGRIPKADSGRSLVMAAATVGSALGQGLKGLHRPRRTVMAATAAALVVGALLGAWNRPRDLLAAGAPEPKGPPALWLDPSWAAVPRQPSARLQYRHAQLRAAEEDRRAAWLAVPGYFPADRERAFQAYTQLARSLLRRRDAAGLDGLAAALEHAAGLEHDHLTDLVRVVRAAAAALRGDPEDVVEQFKGFDPTLNVAVLNELGLEVTLQALRLGRRAGPYLTPLRTLRGALAEALSLDGTDLPESAAPG